jgi:alanine-synthesizing transaminase
VQAAGGQDVIDLGMGNPSGPRPQDDGDREAGRGRPRPRQPRLQQVNGILNLRREVAAKYFKRYGVRLDPDERGHRLPGSKEGFSHMCLAAMGPGDTAIIPRRIFPIHMYAVAMASGNVITLEVSDSEKFLSNIAYTCQHLYPRPKLLILNYPHNPSTAGRAGVLRRGGEAGPPLRLHGDQRLRLRRRGVRRLPAAQLPGRAGGADVASSSPR